MKPIGSFTPSNPFFLAPMEAVNCASFRILCRKRGAALVYTDMVDADKFKEHSDNSSVKDAIKKLINPQPDEKPLAVQLAGSNIDNLLFAAEHVQKYCSLIDFNAGCPLSYMLGKKGGCYLMKHPDQLYRIIKALREKIKIPFTVKLRSGWDDSSINVVEVSQELEKLGVDAVAVHARTLKQGYAKKSDWQLVRKVKDSVNIPVILSGDVSNPYLAYMAFQHTKADFIMIGRAARANPSVFTLLKKADYSTMPAKPSSDHMKDKVSPLKDFLDFLKLYKERETRSSFSEIRDHALWTSIGCKGHAVIAPRVYKAKSERQLLDILRRLRF